MKSPLKIIAFFTTTLFWAMPHPLRADGSVHVLSVTGIIDSVISDYVVQSIQNAEEENASAVLIELDTPGGLLDATRELNSAMLNTRLPVIVYIGPRGARATSAGLFITMAADVAAMAPETHIGAAHPVNVGGENTRFKINKSTAQATQPQRSDVMEEKMVSDAAAYIRTLAAERGRNAAWAEEAVRESVSLTADEALKKNVIDLIASSRPELITALNGREIKKNGVPLKLNFSGALAQERPMSALRRFLHLIAHPNVAYILMMIGIYGLIYEFASPGIGLGGVVGGTCLLVAFFSLHVLPINTVGIVLIALGVLFIITELFTPTHGLLAIGGLVAFAFGSIMLIDTTHQFSVPRVSLALILPSVAITALFFIVVVRTIVAARRSKPRVGSESMVGLRAEVKETLSPEGLVFVNGELWRARAGESIEVGESVLVEKIDGLVLVVKKST